MKCLKCGADLENGVLFCRECGSKVEKQVCFCRECGSKIEGESKFCSNCGAKVELQAAPVEPVQTKFGAEGAPAVEPVVEENRAPDTKQKDSFGDKLKEKISAFWCKLSLYGKVTTIAIGIFALMCLVAILAGKTAAIVISLVQIAVAVVSILMHKGIVKLEQKKLWLKWLVLSVAILFTVLNVMSYSWGMNAPSTGEDPSSNTNAGSKVEQIDWKNITLSAVLPEPQSNLMDLLYNGEDWLSVTIHNLSENDYLEYVRWCKEDYGFTVDSDSFDGYFYAYNEGGYCVTLLYDEESKELNINLDAPTGETTTDPEESTEGEQTEQTEQTEPNENGTLSITKGTEYAYMTDEWNVYIATAISDGIIKIENWNKAMSNSTSVSHEYDVGTFKINDDENEFAWVDDEHTTFVITFTDKKNGDFKKGGTATFTINISDSDKNKGSNYSEEIACFTYENDDWHMYRAIPLTETLIKIECWYRGSSIGYFLFGYDVCVIDTTSGDTDFEWTDDEHTSFSITMRDEENKSEWKKETFVVFILENEDYTHFDVKSYLGKWEVNEGEVAVPASASEFKYDNYQDVQKMLEDAGFTNITTAIQYDIVWGWTDEGEVESVSIDGRTDYAKGEVFKQEAPIVITYHMKEEDDPNKPTETEPPETEPSEPSETEAPIPNLTAENCPDLAALLALKDPSDSSVAAFARNYSGRIIEFDGCVTAMQNHGSYTTRWDVLLGAGDFDPNSMRGPNFRLTDVNYYDMNVSGGDSVYVGLNVHVVAKVGKYNANTSLFELDIISMEIR